MKNNVVTVLEEIGFPIYKLISRRNHIIDYDVNLKLINKTKNQKYDILLTECLHI